MELEFAYLLNSDEDIDRITILENSHSVRMIEELEVAGIHNINRITDLESFAPDPGNGLEILVQVLELGLHNRKQLLQQGLADAARELGRQVDALFLGYGLCGNAWKNPMSFYPMPACRYLFPWMKTIQWMTVSVWLSGADRATMKNNAKRRAPFL